MAGQLHIGNGKVAESVEQMRPPHRAQPAVIRVEVRLAVGGNELSDATGSLNPVAGDRANDVYERLWREAVPALRANEVEAEPLPELGSPRWGVSALLRLDSRSSIARRLAGAAERIGRPAGGHHVVYGPELLHTTVRSIEGFRGVVAPDDPAVEHYADVLEEEVRRCQLAIHYAGVAPTKTGVLAQGRPVDGSLADLRARLHERLADRAPVPGPETDAPRDLAHASLMLFTGPLADPEATVAALDAHREVDFGVARFEGLELVRLERGPSCARIVPLRRVELAG